MRTATLTRDPSTDEGTFGHLMLDDGWRCATVELPWRDNANRKSCIPADTYTFRMFDSPAHGPCYKADNVPGRDFIEIHSANWAGDVDKGFFSQLLGCMAPGYSTGPLETPFGTMQRAVLRSRLALEELERRLGGEPFALTIEWAQPDKEEASP